MFCVLKMEYGQGKIQFSWIRRLIRGRVLIESMVTEKVPFQLKSRLFKLKGRLFGPKKQTYNFSINTFSKNLVPGLHWRHGWRSLVDQLLWLGSWCLIFLQTFKYTVHWAVDIQLKKGRNHYNNTYVGKFSHVQWNILYITDQGKWKVIFLLGSSK
jgi:hypothetical protein